MDSRASSDWAEQCLERAFCSEDPDSSSIWVASEADLHLRCNTCGCNPSPLSCKCDCSPTYHSLVLQAHQMFVPAFRLLTFDFCLQTLYETAWSPRQTCFLRRGCRCP